MCNIVSLHRKQTAWWGGLIGYNIAYHLPYGLISAMRISVFARAEKAALMIDEVLIQRLRDKARALPEEPGVYIMRNKAGEIIYIGKAKVLRNRVSSYFTNLKNHLPKVYRMVENVKNFDFIITASEFEALVLECSMIKQHTPKYNILLKDDKGYSYIKITNESYPRLLAVMQKAEDKSRYIGPYLSHYVVKQTVDEARKAFLLPSCQRRFPQDFGKGRPCLNFHMKQCIGLCKGNVTQPEYGELVSQAVDFIEGGTVHSIAQLTARMEEASERLEFEKAARFRDRINAITRITDKQRVILTKEENQDVIALIQGVDDTAAVLMKFRGGRLVDKEDFLLGETADIAEARGEFLARYYQPDNDIPPRVAMDGETADLALLQQLLSERAGHKVEISTPQRGEQLKLVETARLNAAQQLTQMGRRTGRELAALDELARLLGLPRPPSHIEAYDISNIGSDTIVGGMVVFQDGRPQKSLYKRFAIRDTNGPDDYKSMAQMLERRFVHYLDEKGSGTSFAILPDLILIDGGKGHLAVALGVLHKLGLDIPAFGMVKDDKHRTRAIASDNGEIAISANRSAFTLISGIQNEAHRFSVEYSHKKHKTASFELSLRTVSGIGPSRAKALFKAFKTMSAMKLATLEKLADVKGMSVKTAQALYSFLHAGDEKAVDNNNKNDDN